MLIRTPSERFDDLPGFTYDRHTVSLGEPEMAYVDVGSGDDTFLLLHGEPTWSYLYRDVISTLADRGRVIAPDLIGFGRSEKYVNEADYSFGMHYESVLAFIEELDLEGITLVGQDWGGVLGLPAGALEYPERFDRLVALNTGVPDGTQEMSETWHRARETVETAQDLDVGAMVDAGCAAELSEDVRAAYNAPFHTEEAMAGVRTMMGLVPTNPDDEGADVGRRARAALAEWDKPAFVLFSDSDPILSSNRDHLRETIATATDQPDVWIEGAGHFLQEDAGREIGEEILAFVSRTG